MGHQVNIPGKVGQDVRWGATPRLTIALVVSLACLFGTPRQSSAQVLTDAARMRIAGRLQASSVAIELGQSRGSGFVATAEGWLVTNAHVAAVGGVQPMLIHYGDGTMSAGQVLLVDESLDLAIIAPSLPSKVRPLTLGDSRKVAVGQTVLVYGNPFGLQGTLTQGIVSARRRLPGLGGVSQHEMIQTDAPINPGNSGGPLVNTRGEVVGVATAILSRSGGSHGIGFAIPMRYVKQVLQRLRAIGGQADGHGGGVLGGRPPPGSWIGFFGEDFVDREVRGVRVQKVVPDSPAAEAGLLGGADPPPVDLAGGRGPWRGHIVVGLDDTPVAQMADLLEFLRGATPEQQVVVHLLVAPGSARTSTLVRLRSAGEPGIPTLPPLPPRTAPPGAGALP